MAIGIAPNYKADFSLAEMGKNAFLVYATDAARQLNWEITALNENGFFAHTQFSWTSWSEEIEVKIEGEIAHVVSKCTGSQLTDWGKNKKNVEAFFKKIEDVKLVLTQEEVEIKFVELQKLVNSEGDVVLEGPSSIPEEKAGSFIALFKPVEGYFVAPILFHINLILFLLMVVSGVNIFLPEYNDLLSWGANFRPATLDGEWWRLFSSCFIHIGLLHFLFNMYALVYIGTMLEPYLGKSRFLAAYLISGVVGSVASIWWSSYTVSAGASGAIFGMYGVFLALLTTNLMDQTVKRSLLTSIGIFVGYNLLNGLKPESGIDNAAHIGGLLSGLLMGYAFVPSLKKFENKNLKHVTIGGLAAAVMLSAFAVLSALPNDFKFYQEEMERFSTLEEKALHVYQLSDNTSNEIYLKEIQVGIDCWKENLELLNGLKNRDLPPQVQVKNAKLEEYCEIRLKTFEAMYKSRSEMTDAYQSVIDEYDQKIEKIINEIGTL